MIYLDSSALMKLVRDEAETEALRAWLAGHVELPVVSSELGRVEVLRTARRVGTQVVAGAHAVVDDIDLIPLNRPVQDLATEIGNGTLRTLDTLHLASAALLGDELTSLVAYDNRLIAAAEAVGLTVSAPGRASQA